MSRRTQDSDLELLRNPLTCQQSLLSRPVSVGSSVPLLDDDILVGRVTLYSLAGIEIGLEQRLQAIAPMLGNSLASSIAHNAIVAIDDTKQRDREVLFSIMDTLLSSRANRPDR